MYDMPVLLQALVPWFSGLASLVLLDLAWIGLLAADFYKSRTGHLLNMDDGGMTVNIPAAIATWLVIVTGIQLFVLPRTTAGGLPLAALFWGAAFGAILYAVYNLTNYALLKDWPLSVVVVDILWGAFLCSITATVMALTSRALDHVL
ncbi:MAG TPA: DUF2177 family protein [Candidatus Hydrogenedentes bacterium]|nr:DUF2177 family protein [Candidatus Hydrogenedentota bacterium]